jgi:ABC-type multidrug transport system fused ATPase/permease subunit
VGRRGEVDDAKVTPRDLLRQRTEMLRLLPRGGRLLLTALVATVVVGAVVPPATALATGALVGNIPDAVRQGRGGPAADRALAGLAVLIALLAAQQLLTAGRQFVSYRAVKRIDDWLIGRVYDALHTPVGIAHLQDPKLLDDLALGGGNPTSLTPETPGGAAVGLLVRAGRWASAVGSGLILARVSWVAAVFLLAVALAVRARAHREHLLFVRSQRSVWPAYRRAYYTASLATAPPAAKETRIFGLTDWLVARHEREWESITSSLGPERAKVRSWLVRTQGMLTGAHIAVFAYLGWAATSGRIGLGTFTAALQSTAGLTSLTATSHEDDAVDFGMASLDAVSRIEERAAGGLPGRGPGGRAADGLPRQDIRFEDVSFTYPGAERPALRGLTLELPAGRSVAIVGANGAGKTTLVKLLARLYEPDAGRITVDGTDLADLDPAGWRRRLAVIFQDFERYELPARDNIGFGALPLRGDDAAVATAVRRAGAEDVVARLPAGLDTVLSRRYPGGVDLSGGEWQKIALARALLAVEGGARVLVLDEPTANLDVRAEAELFETFLELTSACTTVLISHRFSTVRRADLIYVLDPGGRVVEAGTHDDLIGRDGRYAQLFSLQAARFAR